HTIFSRDWSSDVCSSDLGIKETTPPPKRLLLAYSSFILNVSASSQLTHWSVSHVTIFTAAASSKVTFASSRFKILLISAAERTRSEERRVGKAGGGRRSR